MAGAESGLGLTQFGEGQALGAGVGEGVPPGAQTRVVTITEYPGVGHLSQSQPYGQEYADQGLAELNDFHRLGLGVRPGQVKRTEVDTGGYDMAKVMEHLGDTGFNRLESFQKGPNMFQSMGLPPNGMEGFQGIDRGLV